MKKLVFVFAVFSMAALTAADMLVNVSVEPAGSNCANGGVKIEVGADDDEDGSLDEGEIDETHTVCNGENNTTPPVSITEVQPSASGQCKMAGGLKITIGTGSSTQTKYICNGTDGTNALIRTSEITSSDTDST